MLKPNPNLSLTPHLNLDNSLIILSLFPGVRADHIQYIMSLPDVRSVVLRTYGSGNAPKNPQLLEALHQGSKNGKVIVNVSQCLQGHVEMHRYDTGYQLQEAGVISGYDSTVESAVTKLMYLLGGNYSIEECRTMLDRPLKGEFTSTDIA
jgi:L-asparaginase